MIKIFCGRDAQNLYQQTQRQSLCNSLPGETLQQLFLTLPAICETFLKAVIHLLLLTTI